MGVRSGGPLVRKLGLGMVVPVRSSRAARRPRGVLGHRAVARHLHGHLPRARHDAGHLHPAAGARGGDVQPRRERPQRRRRLPRDAEGPMNRRLAQGVFAALRAAAVAAVAIVVALALWLAWPVPASLLARDAAEGISIEDRQGLVLRSTRAVDGSQVRWLSFAELDPDLINAFVAVEDRRFWDHHGVDLRAVARATRDNLRARHVVSGASTITMQLARLLAPAERSWGGKAGQSLWAVRLELHLDKQRILEQYLNRVHLGQATVGVGAASALYFDAPASEVSIAQAATLAALAHAPSRDNPYVSPKRARARRAYALGKMRRLGYALRDDVARAAEEPLIGPRRTPPFAASHFTKRVVV